MDKRRSPRYAISLNALVHPTVGRAWLCGIRDFCTNGMLLVEQDGGRKRTSVGISQGELVRIHFNVPVKGQDQHFRLEGKIVRVMDTGVGINFPKGMQDDAMAALLSFSSSQPLSSAPAQTDRASDSRAEPATDSSRNFDLQAQPGQASGIDPATARQIIGNVRKEVSRILPEMNSAFFSYMDQELLVLARDARTNSEQSAYFEAMSSLEKAKKNVSQSFINEILDQIDKPRNLEQLLDERKAAERARKQQSNRIKLSLVSTDEFEDWLAVANIISRSERVYDKYLDEIQTRLGMLVDAWGHSEANPLGTSVFCHAFENAIHQVELTKQIRQKIYSGFEAKAIPLLRKLYIAVTKLLEDSGVFPDLDDDYISPTPVVTPSVPEPEPKSAQAPQDADAEQAEQAEDDDDVHAELRAEVDRLQSQLRARGETAPVARDRRQRPEIAPQQSGGRQRRGEGRRSDIGEAIGNIYSTVRNLMGKGREPTEVPADYDEADIELVQLDEVQGLLTTLQQEISHSRERVPVVRRLQESLNRTGGRRRIAPQTMRSLGVVENLVDTIEDDNMLSASAKDWIRQLELTLDKVAAANQDFLNDERPHRSLEVLNQLARLSGSESGSVRRNVDEIVSTINENFDSDPHVFDEALKKLTPLVERQTRAFTGNVQRTVKASEGQQTLVNAQRAVVDEMNNLLSGRQVPEILMKLLVPGWRNLLVNTHLRQGSDSKDWQSQLHALSQVLQHLDSSGHPETSPAYVPPEQLIDQIERGLDSIAYEPGQRTPLINTLRRFIVDGEDPSHIPLVDVPEDAVASTLGFGDVSERDKLRAQIRNDNESDDEWRRWCARAERLHVGEWLEVEGGIDDDKIAIIAWTDDERSIFVLVNRRGVKTHELMLEELALRLKQGSARILEESDIPLTDRASHRMLQNMHNQLTHQATHDELTGLINRKEFERELVRVLGLAKRNGTFNLVGYMDLDQFKVINSSVGHDAGDRLLVEVAKLLLDKNAQKMTLARLGGDEFGVLIEDCDRDSALSVVKQLCDAIREHRFKWGKDTFSLTASCGVVYVDSDVESVAAILSGADSACFAAKDAGRDRVQVYEADDSIMEHRRDVMEFVAQLDRAIEQDRFILNCQKIAAIDRNSGEHDHYEILLTVLDENNEPMPPQDFIVAAETYNRMGLIDRWVIKNAFRFIAANILKLDNLGAFSINISGNSLNEDDFMEFVLEQFHETRLPTSKVCFEITETSAISRLDSAIDFMEKMKIVGVQFSLDDFGTGLSSYSYLRNLPVDFLKIDGIFVKDIKDNPNDYAVVKSINEIGHFMGKKTIAEFVEDEEILEILREIGVDFAQGYGIEHKRPISELVS